MPNFLLGFLTNNKKGENEMKKNLMFFALGVSTTLLMGAGISYWNQINQANKYGVLVNSLGSSSTLSSDYIPIGNKYGVLVNSLGSSSTLSSDYIPIGNKYGVLVNSLGSSSTLSSDYIPIGNKYGVLVNSLGSSSTLSSDYIPIGNKYALVFDGEVGENATKAMVVGFIHGLAIGRKETKYAKEEGADSNSNSRFKKSLFEDSRFKKSL